MIYRSETVIYEKKISLRWKLLVNCQQSVKYYFNNNHRATIFGQKRMEMRINVQNGISLSFLPESFIVRTTDRNFITLRPSVYQDKYDAKC